MASGHRDRGTGLGGVGGAGGCAGEGGGGGNSPCDAVGITPMGGFGDGGEKGPDLCPFPGGPLWRPGVDPAVDPAGGTLGLKRNLAYGTFLGEGAVCVGVASAGDAGEKGPF